MTGNEDDTFRVLRRRPVEEVADEIIAARAAAVQKAQEEFNKNVAPLMAEQGGYTFDEFNEAWEERTTKNKEAYVTSYRSYVQHAQQIILPPDVKGYGI